MNAALLRYAMSPTVMRLWAELTMILIAYFAGLRSKGRLTLEAALFRVGVYLTFMGVIIASELSKVPDESCLTFKPLAYVTAIMGSFFVAWFHET